MNTPAESPSIKNVLDDFALADPQPSDVSEWTDRYPHHADEISAFAEEWFAMADTSEQEREISEDELLSDRDRFMEAGLAAMQERLAETQSASAPQSLSELLSRRGIKAPDFRNRLGLSRRFWSSIKDHPVARDTAEAATIWERIVSTFARVLDAPQEWVEGVIDNSAAPSLSFSSSDRRPVSGEPVDIEQLVQSDSGLDPRTREFFLTGEGPLPGTVETDE